MKFQSLINHLQNYIQYQQQERMNQLLDDIKNLQESQLNQLNNIHLQLNALQLSPIEGAMTHIKDATKSHRDYEQKLKLVNEAKSLLVQARGTFVAMFNSENAKENKSTDAYEKYIETIITIEVQISLCWLLLESKLDAVDWLNNSIHILEGVLKKLNDRVLLLRAPFYQYLEDYEGLILERQQYDMNNSGRFIKKFFDDITDALPKPQNIEPIIDDLRNQILDNIALFMKFKRLQNSLIEMKEAILSPNKT